MTSANLLAVEDLRLEFDTPEGSCTALEDVSFAVKEGEILGVVGESGAGKTVLGRSLLGLVADNGRITAGEVRFDGRNIVDLGYEQLRAIRGNEISMIFQNPSEALNPTLTVGKQLKRAIRWNSDGSPTEEQLEARATDILTKTGIPSPGDRLDDYPHEFSGGMKQRVLIAMALVGNPSLLVADEPTTALDVTIEAQILRLLKRLRKEFDLSIVYITHNLAVENYISDRFMVMYAGEIAELGPTREILRRPRHPYTSSLLQSVPTLEDRSPRPIPGSMPDIGQRPSGCRFHPRCEYATEVCESENPVLESVESGRKVACHHHDEVDGETGVLKQD
jgi:peptide/nickel transport system ATP-binding protein